MFDYIVVGQGISGSLLSYFLLQKNKNICIIDNDHNTSSSTRAVGLLNPITGKFTRPTWMAETFFPFAWQTYKKLQEVFDAEFIEEVTALRVFQDENALQEVKNYYSIQQSAGLISSFIEEEINIPNLSTFNYGGFEVNQSGLMHMNKFVEAATKYFKKNNIYINEKLEIEDIKINKNEINWKDINCKNLIFCEGFQAVNNKYFSYLPIHPAKGEAITFSAPDLFLKKVLNFEGLHLIPLGNGNFYLGATYDRTSTDLQPTAEKFEFLKYYLDKVLQVPYTITAHVAGVRPGVKDRKPLLGMHPLHQNIGIFNGMGSKAITQAPWLAAHFADFLVENKPILKEVDIKRYLHQF